MLVSRLETRRYNGEWNGSAAIVEESYDSMTVSLSFEFAVVLTIQCKLS